MCAYIYIYVRKTERERKKERAKKREKEGGWWGKTDRKIEKKLATVPWKCCRDGGWPWYTNSPSLQGEKKRIRWKIIPQDIYQIMVHWQYGRSVSANYHLLFYHIFSSVLWSEGRVGANSWILSSSSQFTFLLLGMDGLVIDEFSRNTKTQNCSTARQVSVSASLLKMYLTLISKVVTF